MPENEAAENNYCSGLTLRAIGWVSVGLGIAAVGIYVGNEIRKRYEFNHRTPYDFYANAGSKSAPEFGMGV